MNSAINICVQVFIWIPAFNSFGYIPWSGIAGSYSNSVFNFLRNYHRGCSILHSHQQCMMVLISPHHCQYLLFSGVFFLLVILVHVKYFIVVLTSISLMANDVEHFFMCLLAFCMFFEEMSLQVLCPFTHRFVFFVNCVFFKFIERMFCLSLLNFIYLFIYGCVGSSFLCEGFLQLWQAGATLHRCVRASHYRGLSCCGAQAPDAQA